MKIKNAFILMLPMLFVASVAFAQNKAKDTEQVLKALDKAIEHKAETHSLRISRADSIRSIVSSSTGEERINALFSLYALYESFQADSSLSVLRQFEALPEYKTDNKFQAYIEISKARTYGVMGLYTDANECLQKIDPDSLDDRGRLNYFNALHALYGWMADFTEYSQPNIASNLRDRAASLHDSILMLEPIEQNRTIIRTNKMYDYGQYKECIDTLLHYLNEWDTMQEIFAYSRLAQAYEKIGDINKTIHYLALTSLGDLKNGNTEYMALPLLAEYLFTTGDDERAYRYLLCAMEDATYCNAGLRTIESSKIFPIINEARKESEQRQHNRNSIIQIILIFWGVMLTAGIWGLRRQHKRLQHVRQALSETNNSLKLSNMQLQSANKKLIETDKMKEEYLLEYLSRSRKYLASMESFQNHLYRLFQTHQMDELSKQLRSTQVMSREQADFYTDFDEAFINLYPNFIHDFNELLIPEARIEPKRGEILSTELRIFALIRLGETDSNKIAKFLGYSLTTIYNYRSRVRNNALGDKDKFEDMVMAL